MKKKIFLGLFLSSLAYGSTSYPLFEKRQVKMEIITTWSSNTNNEKSLEKHKEKVNLKLKQLHYDGKVKEVKNVDNEITSNDRFVTFITYETER